VVTINILVRHPPANEEQVLDGRSVSLLPEELVVLGEERNPSREPMIKPRIPFQLFLHLSIVWITTINCLK
jgi:hypothetical protein